MLKSFCFLGLFSLTLPLVAQVEMINLTQGRYSRAEGFLLGDNLATTTTIYGGLSGPDCGSSPLSTCDSCENSTGESCNSQRIHDNLILVFTFNFMGSTNGVSRPVMITSDVDNSVGGQRSLNLAHSNFVLDSQTGVQAHVSWREVCQALFQLSSCEDLNQGLQPTPIRVGVDADGDGFLNTATEYSNHVRLQVARLETGPQPLCQEGGPAPDGPCNFIAVPGDQKVYIRKLQAPCSFPNPGSSQQASSVDFQSIRVFYEALDSGVRPSPSSPSKDLALSPSGGGAFCQSTKEVALVSDQVEGLSNNQAYRFAIGALDRAQNLGFITGGGAPEEEGDSSGCFKPEDWPQNCHIARPLEVIGLIEKELDCFIATASFGSPHQPMVADLRKFRNRFLYPSPWGRSLIRFYYAHSPPLARWIRNHPWSKPVVRLLLKPFWLVAKGSLLAFHGRGQEPKIQKPGGQKVGAGTFKAPLQSFEKPIKKDPRGVYYYKPSKKKKNRKASLPELEQPYKIGPDGSYYYGDKEMKKRMKSYPGVEEPVDQDSSGAYYYSPKKASKKPRHLYGPPPSEVRADGSYIYDLKVEETRNHLFVGAGLFSAPRSFANQAYPQIYGDQSRFLLSLEYDWHLFSNMFLKLGSGFVGAMGPGRFGQGQRVPGLQPEESFQFFIFPNTLNLSYKFQFWKAQRLTPYVEAGPGYFSFIETRSDGSVFDFSGDTTKLGGAMVANATLGVLLSLSRWGWGNTLSMDYGAHQSWLSLQYRQVFGLNSRKDFSSQLMTAGLALGF